MWTRAEPCGLWLRLAVALVASAGAVLGPWAGCGGGGGSGAPDLPAGWTGTEMTELRVGRWRFFHITDTKFRTSVSEENYVLRGDAHLAGVDGIREFVRDDEVRAAGAPPARLAAQLGMFLVQGTSRSSCHFSVVDEAALASPQLAAVRDQLHAPETVRGRHGHVHRAWIRQDTGLRHLVVRWNGDVTVDFREQRPLP